MWEGGFTQACTKLNLKHLKWIFLDSFDEAQEDSGFTPKYVNVQIWTAFVTFFDVQHEILIVPLNMSVYFNTQWIETAAFLMGRHAYQFPAGESWQEM